MDIPSHIPAQEDGRLTAQPWGKHQVEQYSPDLEATWIAQVESSAREKRLTQARRAVEEALDDTEKGAE